MADMTAPTSQAPTMAPPVHTDDQIMPRIRCQLDEQWFVLTKDTLREALQITPVNSNQAFISPPTTEALINFVNELGYPKAPVLQILWGIVKRANIDYAERIWEEFTQSIHTFIEDKRNLSRHTSGKKRSTLIVIPSIRFTKLIIHHIQRRHKFHPRTDSALHLPNEEPVLGYLKFSAKGTKREVFGMPIPGSLITAVIREASYYQEYLAKVAQHRRYLACETGGVQDPPAPKPTQPAKMPKSKPTKARPRPAVTSIQPAPTSAPAEPQAKKHKQATETSDKPPKAKKSKYGWVSKKRSLKHEATLEAEDVPVMEPQVAAEDAELQKVLDESMKTAYALPRGPFPPVVIREPESGKYQPLPEVPRKGKAKVTEEQSDSEEESKKVVLGATEGGQARSNPDEISEGQARPDPGNAGDEEQSIPSPVVHVGSDREHMDLDVVDVSPQPSTERLDEGFTATAYPKVQENLKLAVEEQVLLEEPASSSGTLSSLQHLSRDISFGDQFFGNKPSNADKNAKTKVESMVNVPIQQSLSSISLMTSPIVDLTSRPESPKVHQQFKATTTDTTTTTTTTLPPPQAQQQSIAEAMMVKRIGELKHIMANLIQVNKDIEEKLNKHGARLYTLEQLEIPQQRMWETESYKTHEDHKQLFEAFKKSMNCDHSEELAQDLAEARKKKKKSRESPKTPPGSPSHQPPPPPPPAGPSGPSGAPGAFESSQVPPPPPPLSTSQESPLRPSISLTPADLEMDEDIGPDEQAQLSDDEDIGSAHIPTVNLRQGWWKPFEAERPTTLKPAWSIRSSDVPFCKRRGITELKPQDLEGPAYEIVKVFHPDVIHLQYQMEEYHKLLSDSVDDPLLRHKVNKPLPLGGPPGQVTIQSDFFFNKDLEYLRYGSKGSRPALSISKIKAAYYPDARLEQIVPDQVWINEECKYDIAAMYGISHWWFQRQRFYIDRHTSEGDRRTVRTHMWILSVVRIEVFSMYGYNYMKKIVLHRADLNKHVIAERDFKYLYPSDFEDLYLLNLQGHLNHLPPKDKKILTTAVNQWIQQLVIRQRVEDFLAEPHQTSMGCYGFRMMMLFNEIHKFSNGTLQQIDETLYYRVKEFRVNKMNPGLNTRFWTRKDVDRCKAFMFAIQRRLRTRRIFCNLESFVGRCKHLPLSDIEDSVMDPVTHKFNPLATQGLSTDSSFTSHGVSRISIDFLTLSEDGNPARANIKQALGIPTVTAAGQKDVNSQLHAHTSNSLSITAKNLQHSFCNSELTNSDTAFESFSLSPILVEDSDSLMEGIDLSFTPDDLMPPGIEEDDYDFERDILILEELLSNNSLLLSENESFHFDIPLSSRPPAKPPDGNT
nr:E-beta-farnesene synthase [Tanacetum cinerariifolium]